MGGNGNRIEKVWLTFSQALFQSRCFRTRALRLKKVLSACVAKETLDVRAAELNCTIDEAHAHLSAACCLTCANARIVVCLITEKGV